jgi:hypothetical protein
MLDPMKLRCPALLLGTAGVVLLSVGCMRIHPPRGRTTLSQPGRPYEAILDPFVEVIWPIDAERNMEVVLAGNSAFPPLHNDGYNGIVEIHYGDGPSPFVPLYAGLNLEHVNNGAAYEERHLQFEPRRHPMEIRKLSDTIYELYQPPLPNTGLESCTRFEFKSPHYIDVTFECIPRAENFPYGYLNLFWASYIMKPKYPTIHFLGRSKGDEIEKWIKGETPKHGLQATHRAAYDQREFRREEPFPLTLVFNESDYEYSRPAYYGRCGARGEWVWMVMFHRKDMIRFTQSPSGGGEGNPAWDFQWFIENPEVGKLYRMSYRAVYKPWVSQIDLVDEYERYRRNISP